MNVATAPTGSPSPATTPEANGSGVTVVPSLEERSASAFGSSEAGTDGAPPSPPAVTPSEPASGDSDHAKARAERRAALAKLQAEERTRVDTIAAIRERDDLRQKLAALEAKQPSPASNLVDVDALDEDGLLGLLDRSKRVTPQRIGERLRELIANPELAAAHAATRAVDPKLAALEKQNAELAAKLETFVTSQQTAQQQAEEQRHAEAFFAFTRDNAEASPCAAHFLATFGPEEFHKVALSVAPHVPPGAGPQALLDELEENLSASFYARMGGVPKAEMASPQRPQAIQPTPNPAAAKAPIHVSNTLAQQRSSVVDDDENWAALPFEERSARVFR